MPYVKPQATVRIEFNRAVSPLAQPRNAVIFGGLAELIRFSEADEQVDGALGFYDDVSETAYGWPNLGTGIVDQTYTQLHAKNALLQYAAFAEGSGSNIVKVAGYTNRIRSSAVVFAENDAADRDADLYSRDVKIGDVIRVRSTPVSGDPIVLWTTVKDLVGDVVAATIGSATADADNAATAAASATVEQTAGVVNCVEATASAASYDGRVSGHVTETYTIRVVEASSNGDHTTAVLRVFSSDGEDDQLEVVPSAAGDPTDIGTRGLTVTFDPTTGSCSESADNEEVPHDDLLVGQEWTVDVVQLLTASVGTAAGTYSSTQDTTYVVTVTRGGLWAELPQITVSTTNGVDYSGPTNVTAAATAVAVGTRGVTIAFNTLGLVKGDRFTIEVEGKSTGALKTIVLSNSLSTDVANGEEVGITLYMKKDSVTIPYGTDTPPNTNYEQSETEITVASGITLTDSEWHDNGELLPLPLKSYSVKNYGKLYVTVRYWLQTGVNTVNSVFTPSEALDLPGPYSPDNPLKFGVYQATLNSNAVAVRYVAVSDPSSTTAWNNVLTALEKRTDVYGLVPLTRDREIQDLVVGHVTSMSSESVSKYRRVWLNVAGATEIPIVHAGTEIVGYITATTEDGEEALATVTDDPDTSGTQYTIVNVPAGNANFVTNGTLPGDLVRVNFVDDGFGTIVYDDFVIAEVISEDAVRLVTGPDAAINVAQKIEVWRSTSAAQESEAISTKQLVGWGGEGGLVSAVMPDEYEVGTDVVPGYFLCCNFAGLVSGVLPHQGLTRLELIGPTAVPRIKNRFSEADLDLMAEAGVNIVTQDDSTGQIYSRHCVTATTDNGELESEESIVRNAHDVARRIKELTEPYLGVTNVQPFMREVLEQSINSLANRLMGENSTKELGGQITEVFRVSVTIPEGSKTTFETLLDASFPGPTNVIRNVLRVS